MSYNIILLCFLGGRLLGTVLWTLTLMMLSPFWTPALLAAPPEMTEKKDNKQVDVEEATI